LGYKIFDNDNDYHLYLQQIFLITSILCFFNEPKPLLLSN
jgi:hypothetical protein